MKLFKKILVTTSLILGVYLGITLTPQLFLNEPDDQLETYLREYNKYPAITPPVTDREFWDSIPERPSKIPPNPNLHPHDRIRIGTAQEAAYNTGEWIPLIESGLEETIASPWHDANKYEKPMVGWRVTQLTAFMAHTLATLDGKLNEDLVSRTKKTIRERVIYPYLEDVRSFQTRKIIWHKDSCPWLEKDTNWRAVCVANILYAGLIVEDDLKKQAEILRTSIEQADLYLKTFEKDGYLAAGIRYWNWGFRHYVLLAERILHATGGKVNLYESDKVRRIVEFQLAWNLENKITKKEGEIDVFGEEVEEKKGVRDFLEEDIAYYPIFADNSNPSTSMPQIRYILSQRFKTPYVGSPLFRDNYEILGPFYSAALGASQIKTSRTKINEKGGDYLVHNAKAAIIRDPNERIVLAIKGGHNGEEHNHNDLGGYTIFQSKMEKAPWEYVTGDAGFGSYAKGTFNADLRYTFPLLGSYGHPVPVVDNTLQSDGFEYTAEMIRHSSNPKRFSIEYDLKNAYNCPKLKELHRKITYEKDYRALVVKDSFKASSPITFETPIITRTPPANLEDIWSFKVDDKEYIIEITSSEPSSIKRSTIASDFKGQLYRTTTSLKEPANEGYIEYRIRPKVNSGLGKEISKTDITGTYSLTTYAGNKKEYGKFRLSKGKDKNLTILKNISNEIDGKMEVKQGLIPLCDVQNKDVLQKVEFNLTPWYPYNGVEDISRQISYTILGELAVRESFFTEKGEKIKTTLETDLKVEKIEPNKFDTKIYLKDVKDGSKYALSIFIREQSTGLIVETRNRDEKTTLIEISFKLDQGGILLYKLTNEDRN